MSTKISRLGGSFVSVYVISKKFCVLEIGSSEKLFCQCTAGVDRNLCLRRLQRSPGGGAGSFQPTGAPTEKECLRQWPDNGDIRSSPKELLQKITGSWQGPRFDNGGHWKPSEIAAALNAAYAYRKLAPPDGASIEEIEKIRRDDAERIENEGRLILQAVASVLHAGSITKQFERDMWRIVFNDFPHTEIYPQSPNVKLSAGDGCRNKFLKRCP